MLALYFSVLTDPGNHAYSRSTFLTVASLNLFHGHRQIYNHLIAYISQASESLSGPQAWIIICPPIWIIHPQNNILTTAPNSPRLEVLTDTLKYLTTISSTGHEIQKNMPTTIIKYLSNDLSFQLKVTESVPLSSCLNFGSFFGCTSIVVSLVIFVCSLVDSLRD